MEDKRDDTILSIRGMSKSFGRNRVLDHINLDVKKGTVMHHHRFADRADLVSLCRLLQA